MARRELIEASIAKLKLINIDMKKINCLTVALVLATATVAGVTGCAGDRYNQSTGEHIDDAATTGRVKDSLGKRTPCINIPMCASLPSRASVQLSGFVDNRAQKSQAGMLAKNTDGVKDVVNNISVKE